ncbi:P-loop NTPase family protein [Odoribacter splanchnicus]|uniref:ATP-binding protein n=1 Tax=Odoribacter splanchnicus TaxID=28118 RepID=UPI001F46F766|nr:ATP-binding protein [Odoribacter splanchnicus]
METTVENLIRTYQNRLITHRKTIQNLSDVDLSDPKTLKVHESIVVSIGENYCNREGRKFEIDDNNEKLFRFLLYYFNGSKKALEIFPEKQYALHKNILLVGEPGCGKTMMMQIFSDYLKITDNPNKFHNLSITQMVNYYKIHSNIDRYTYNEADAKYFNGNPFNICLNDIGIDIQQKSFGTNIDDIVNEFLFARYEIFQNNFKRTHLTSNLSTKDFKEKYEERLVDRFKNYNVVNLPGKSRRK